jgi:hypothetical protein
MEYAIDNPDKVIDHWLRVFEVISIDQFKNFTDLLGFTTNITLELQEISKQFTLSILNYLGIDIPEPPSSVLYDELKEIDPVIQIWMNIISQLKLLGYANDVYLWGQNISKKVYQLESRTFITEWDILLRDWVQSTSDSAFSPLSLPYDVIIKLQLIIKQCEINRQKLKFQVQQTEENPTDGWEEYALKKLGIGSWIYNNALYQIQLSQWKNIFSTLSKQDLATFDEWGYQNFGPYNEKNYFSLLQFANEIQRSNSS